MTKLFTGIIGILIILACAKDEATEAITQDDQPLHESITGTRSGDPLPQLFLGSLTIYDYNRQTQTIINRDSVESIELAKINKSTVNISNPVNAQIYKASQFRVLFKWKNGSNDYSGIYFVKDTTKTLFTVKPQGSNIGSVKAIEIKQTNTARFYYDYRYFKTKRMFLYQIKSDSVTSEMSLQSWHHPNSNVYLMDHKL